MGEQTELEPASAEETRSARLDLAERVRLRLTAIATRVAPYAITIDGMFLVIVGLYALVGAANSFQGEGFLLTVGGLAIILFGLLMILRWNLSAVRTGLFALTAGYFATALQEFQVATDPCDIGSTLERCADHVPGGLPWLVYQGPLVLAMLLFVFIVFEPLLTPRSSATIST
jgi:hypothetical protein